MAAKTAKAVRARGQAPTALVYRLADFPEARWAIPAFRLTRACRDAPYFIYDARYESKTTLFDAIPEKAAPAAEAKSAFALSDATVVLVRSSSRDPFNGRTMNGFHASASLEEVVRCFEHDGFRVVSAADVIGPPMRPRDPKVAKARLLRNGPALNKVAGDDAMARLVRWLDSGGPEPDVPTTLVTLVASLVLDEVLESYGDFESRALALTARRRALTGFRMVAGDEGLGADRMGIFSAHLARAGWSADEIADAWLDGIVPTYWASAGWFALSLLPRLEAHARRILRRSSGGDAGRALGRLVGAPGDIPAPLSLAYLEGVRRFLETSKLAASIGFDVWQRFSAEEQKAFAKAKQRLRPQPVFSLPPRPKPVARLAEASKHYGLDFPEEIAAVWDLASSLSRKNPGQALWRDLGLRLVGPFEVLAGRLRAEPGVDLRLEARFVGDPPEFVNLMEGDTDGLHYGYWYDDPAHGPACVASYYHNDAYEMAVPGRTLFEAIRKHLERYHRDRSATRKNSDVRALADLARLRERLMQYATKDRLEVGDAYLDKYDLSGLRLRTTVAETFEHMGVAAPASTWRAVSPNGDALRKALDHAAKRKKIIAEALALAGKGYPARALEVGRTCWVKKDQRAEANALLDAAYVGLERPLLRELLAVAARKWNDLIEARPKRGSRRSARSNH